MLLEGVKQEQSCLSHVTTTYFTCRVPLLKVLGSWYSSFARTEKRHPATLLTVLLERFGTHGFKLNVVAELSPGGRVSKQRYPPKLDCPGRARELEIKKLPQ